MCSGGKDEMELKSYHMDEICLIDDQEGGA